MAYSLLHVLTTWYTIFTTYFFLIHRLSEVKFPVHLLPEVKDAGSLAGSLQEIWYGIQPGTPVGVALGDLQCSIISRLQPNDSGTIYMIPNIDAPSRPLLHQLFAIAKFTRIVELQLPLTFEFYLLVLNCSLNQSGTLCRDMTYHYRA